jgi:hypothetical protein
MKHTVDLVNQSIGYKYHLVILFGIFLCLFNVSLIGGVTRALSAWNLYPFLQLNFAPKICQPNERKFNVA